MIKYSNLKWFYLNKKSPWSHLTIIYHYLSLSLSTYIYLFILYITPIPHQNFKTCWSKTLSLSMAELESPMMPKLITFLSSLLERVAESNDETQNHHKISIFHGLSRPNISIQSYLERIFKYANCSSSCFIVAYVYLDRFTQTQPSLPINSFNVHRLLITSVMVAAKFMDDV